MPPEIHRESNEMTTRIRRPQNGWPARFGNWDIGDSMPVAGNMNHVRTCMSSMRCDTTKFKLRFISPTLTRVTRIA